MKLSCLRGRKICDRVLRKGTVWKGKTFAVRWIAGPPRHPHADPAERTFYVGVLATSKLDKSAVKRNRMRRRCREALRVALQERDDLPTIQLLLMPRSISLSCDFEDIRSDVLSFLSVIAHAPKE